MAIKQINEEGGAKKETTTNTSSTTKKQQQPTPRVLDLVMASYGSSGILSAEADEYLKRLRAQLEDSAQPIKIETKRLPKPNGAYAFVSGSAGIIIIFDEDISPNIYEIEKQTRFFDAKTAFESVVSKNTRLINVVLVDRYSYGKYSQMADYISKTLQAANGKFLDNFTIDAFDRQNDVLVIDHNPSAVKEFIKANSPHGVIGRVDSGFICYIAKGYKPTIKGTIEYTDKIPLFAVGGFAELWAKQSIGFGFQPTHYNEKIINPIVRITEIISSIPSPKIIPLILSICGEMFGTYQIWQLPYRTIKKNGPDIGNLILDPKTGKPVKIKTEEELNYVFSNLMNNATIAIDICDGKARIPGIEYLTASAQSLTEIINTFNQFLNTNLPIELVGKVLFQEFVGTCEVKGMVEGEDIIDSRYVDYLNVIALTGSGQNAEQLKYRVGDPKIRVNTITSLVNNFRPQTMAFVTALNPKLITMMSQAISSRVNLINPLTRSITPQIDTSILDQFSYTGGPALSGYSPVGGFSGGNPFVF